MRNFYFIPLMILFLQGASRGAQDGIDLEAAAPKLRFVSSFDVKKPGFITSFPSSAAGKFDLVISSFGVDWPWKPNPDAVRFIPDIAGAISSSRYLLREVKDRVLWPNQVSLVNHGEDVVVPGGFLVPLKNPGHISTMKLKEFRENYANAKWKKLVEDGGESFFHQVEMVNVRGQSFKNSSGVRMVSCRGRKPVIPLKPAGGEMVYLEPTSGGGYEAKVIREGCDTFFEVVDLNKDGIPEFIVPQFFSELLVLLWTDEPTGDYTKPEFVRSRFIDTQIGKAFDTQLTDLDLDGKLEILVTNHQNSKEEPRPNLITYKMTLPAASAGKTVSDFMNGIVFDKAVLSEDFILMVDDRNAGSPGTAVAIRAGDDDTDDYPVIVVSGDGSFKAYLLTRNPDGTYKQEIFHDCGGTVGAIHVKDVDGDGWKEVFVPCYGTNKVVVYTFQPASTRSATS